jgi:uncharacterized protein YdcH (DUF465 family)
MDLLAQDDLKAHLMTTDAQFRQWAEQHSEYDHKLQELEAKHALTDDEQMEEVRLKKLKLHLKDQMVEFMSRYKAEHVA